MENSYINNVKVQKRKWLIMIAIAIFTYMTFLDASIVNIAIPDLSKSLNIANEQAEQVVSIYIMTICMVSLLGGKLGDKFGVIKIFRIGTFIFIIGSFMSGIQIDLNFLLVSRAIQGIGASLTLATNYAIMVKIFPEKIRGRALGWIGTFASLGAITGNGVGGLILTYLSYSYIFWVNVPVGVFAIILGFIVLPKDNSFIQEKIDYLGFIFSSLFIFFVFEFIITGQKESYTNFMSLLYLGLGILFIIIFIIWEHKNNNPLLNLKLFKDHILAFSLIAALLIMATTYFYNMIMPFYLEDALKISHGDAGLLLMAYPVAMGIFAVIAGWASDKFTPQKTMFVGLIAYTITQALFILFDIQTPLPLFIILSLFTGISYAMFQSPNNVLVMSSAPKTSLGTVGSLKSLFQYLGSFIGISFATSTLYMVMSIEAGHKISSYEPSYFIGGMHGVFVVSMSISIIGIIFAAIILFKLKKKSAN